MVRYLGTHGHEFVRSAFDLYVDPVPPKISRALELRPALCEGCVQKTNDVGFIEMKELYVPTPVVRGLI